MKRSLLIYIGSLALVLTAGAQMPNDPRQRKAPQRTTTYSGYRGTSAVRQTAPPRTFSTARFRQPTYSTGRFREPAFTRTRMQPRMNSSFEHRPPTTTNTAAWRRTLPPVTNDGRVSRFSPRPRPSDSFVNRPATRDTAAWRRTRLGANDRQADSNFRERLRTDNSLVKRSLGSNAAPRPAARQPFNNHWADSSFKERSNSFVNRSRSAAFWSGTRAGFTHNWKGTAFQGRQYGAFRNYQSQWHDSGWWRHNCDRIIFVTVYSQPFPFFFDSGYWYPCWGYYPDSYYPYDGPIYGYNDLSPDQVIANVQTQLYNEGYYNGPIDGILGQDTQAAIADYQADHGLSVTAAIDEPTVASLGLG